MPLAIASANRLGADSGITVASVLISGILGAGLGPMVLSLGPEKLAVARGVALGSVSHGLGTAALAASGDSVGASAAVIALGLVGTLTTLLLSSSLARWMTR
jgi:putative effector of murein hydrolase